MEDGKPSETIIKIADDWGADLIVLGTHGRTGLKHLLDGQRCRKSNEAFFEAISYYTSQIIPVK